jgi:hypothetical membrane protein
MPTNWLFWLNVGSVIFGLLIILHGATAKRKPLDVQTRQLLILLGICAIIMSLDMALVSSRWHFPFDSAFECILLLIYFVLLATMMRSVVHRRNYARLIAAQNAQNSLETDEEPDERST